MTGRGARRRSIAFVAVVAAFAFARAERLPIRAYGSNEGLAGDHVRSIVQDSRGFLWLATNSGVSRFDGVAFVNYGVADGLPIPSARKVLEGGDGRIYVVSNETLLRLRADVSDARPAFEPVPPGGMRARVGGVQDLARAPDGGIVVAGERGVVRLAEGTGEARVEVLDLGPVPGPALDPFRACVWAITYDTRGALWAVRPHGITRRSSDGAVTTWPFPTDHAVGPGWGWYPTLKTDRSGRVWLFTTGEGLWRLDTEAPEGGKVVAAVWDERAGLANRFARSMEEDADGTLWIGTASHGGLVRCRPAPEGFRCETLGLAQGFPDDEFFALAHDDQGNLWGGTLIAGAIRIAADGMTSWGEADGLRPPGVNAVQDDGQGGLLIQMGLHLASLRDGRVRSWPVRSWTAYADRAWGSNQVFARDRDGRIWLATGDGVYVYAPGVRPEDLASRAPQRILGTADGLPGNDIIRIFVDQEGDTWIGVINVSSGLCRFRRGTGTIQCFDATSGFPGGTGSAFAEDAAGHLWVGTYEGGLYRCREGRFETWDEVGPGRNFGVGAILRDDAGRLWVSGSPGVLRVDAPDSERPSFHRYGPEDGLTSAGAASVALDREGRVYVGGIHGVDRLDPRSGAVRTFTVADGLPSNRISILHRDPEGVIWVGTSKGIARLDPRGDRKPAPPPVYITATRVAGTARETSRGRLRLESNETNLEFAFTSPSFRAGETMRFRTRLLGASEAWGPAVQGRAVSFANLAPGDYRFEVRAINGDGVASANPAAVEFTIPPPVWRRGWFLALVALAAGAAAVAFFRARIDRAVSLERIRTRIATDLHDDIGSSLSHIAILGQLARRQAEQGDRAVAGSLERITEASGELVDAMGDVVWAVNPVHDRLADLVHRMRRFASELFADSGIELSLDLPDVASKERIDADARRQIYLIFKEALHNALRHSDAGRVEVALRRDGEGFLLRVRDDGRGIETPSAGDGHGLDSMRTRARAIGAFLEIRSSPGVGTEIVLRTGRPGGAGGNHPRG